MIAFVAPLKIKTVCFPINEMKHHHVLHLPFHSFIHCFDTFMHISPTTPCPPDALVVTSLS